MALLNFQIFLVAAIMLGPALADVWPMVFNWHTWQVDREGTATKSEIVRNLGLLVAAVLALVVGTWRAWSAERQTKSSNEQTGIANEQARIANYKIHTSRSVHPCRMV